jgi:hypothetical protein
MRPSVSVNLFTSGWYLEERRVMKEFAIVFTLHLERLRINLMIYITILFMMNASFALRIDILSK